MAELEGALARVPGLAGYLGQEQFTQRANTATLANANQAAGLHQTMDKIQRERGLRQALANVRPDATDEEKLQAILPFVGADTAFKAIEAKKAREATLQTNALLRTRALDDKMAQFREQMDKLKLPEATRRRAESEFRMRIAGANAEYTLPQDVLKNYGISAGSVPGQAPAYADALKAVGGRLNAPFTMEVDPASPQPVQTAQEAPAAPVATPAAPAPVAQPVAAPEQPPVPMPDAGNLDARDLAARAVAPVQGAPVARGEVPPPQGAPVARMAELPKPPPELEASWARLGRKEADKQKAKWLSANIGGGGEAQLDKDGLKVAAWEKLLYGTDPKGLGKASAQQRAQVSNERARIGKALGLTDSEMAMLPQDNKVKMKAIGNMTNWGAGVDKAAEQVEKSLDVAIDYAKKINPTTLQTLNKLIIAGRTEFNDPLVNGYATAIATVAREYGRLLAGPTSNAMLPVEAMKKGDELLSKALDVKALQEVKKVMILDAKITKDAVNNQIDNLRSSISNPGNRQGFLGGDKTADAPKQGAPVARFETNKVYTDAKGRKAKYLGNGKWEEQ